MLLYDILFIYMMPRCDRLSRCKRQKFYQWKRTLLFPSKFKIQITISILFNNIPIINGRHRMRKFNMLHIIYKYMSIYVNIFARLKLLTFIFILCKQIILYYYTI